MRRKRVIEGRMGEASWEWRMKVLTGRHKVVTLYFEQENKVLESKYYLEWILNDEWKFKTGEGGRTIESEEIKWEITETRKYVVNSRAWFSCSCWSWVQGSKSWACLCDGSALHATGYFYFHFQKMEKYTWSKAGVLTRGPWTSTGTWLVRNWAAQHEVSGCLTQTGPWCQGGRGPLQWGDPHLLVHSVGQAYSTGRFTWVVDWILNDIFKGSVIHVVLHVGNWGSGNEITCLSWSTAGNLWA